MNNKLLKYQNYNHYKIPITINPLEYGKLIFKTDNIYIIQVGTFTIAVITQFENLNEVKFFREGDLMFTYKDHKINDNTFLRSLDNKKFTFENNKLININYKKTINRVNLNNIYFLRNNINFINKLGIRNAHSQNIIKLRKVKSKYI